LPNGSGGDEIAIDIVQYLRTMYSRHCEFRSFCLRIGGGWGCAVGRSLAIGNLVTCGVWLLRDLCPLRADIPAMEGRTFFGIYAKRCVNRYQNSYQLAITVSQMLQDVAALVVAE
jgi:hypothetical protein